MTRREPFKIGPVVKTSEIDFRRRDYGSKYDELIDKVKAMALGSTLPMWPPPELRKDPNEVIAFRDRVSAAVRRGLGETPDRRYIFRLLKDGGVAIVCAPPRRGRRKP